MQGEYIDMLGRGKQLGPGNVWTAVNLPSRALSLADGTLRTYIYLL